MEPQNTSSLASSLHAANLSEMSTVDMRRVAELVRQLATSRLEARRLQSLLPTQDQTGHPAAVAAPTLAEEAVGCVTPSVSPPQGNVTVTAPPPPKPALDTSASSRPRHTHASADTASHERHWKKRYSALKAQLRAERESQETELHGIFALVEEIASEADQTRLRGENARLQQQLQLMLSQPQPQPHPGSLAPTPVKAASTSPEPAVVSSYAHGSAVGVPAASRLSLSDQSSLRAARLSAEETPRHDGRPADASLTSFLVSEVETWRQRCLALERERAQPQTRAADVPATSHPGITYVDHHTDAHVSPPATSTSDPFRAAERTAGWQRGAEDGLNNSSLAAQLAAASTSATAAASPPPPPPPYQPQQAQRMPGAHLDAFSGCPVDSVLTEPDGHGTLPVAEAVADPYTRSEAAQARRVHHELHDQQRRHPHVPAGLTGDYAAGSPHWHPQQSPSRRRPSPRRTTPHEKKAKQPKMARGRPDRPRRHTRGRRSRSSSSPRSSSSADASRSSSPSSSTTTSSSSPYSSRSSQDAQRGHRHHRRHPQHEQDAHSVPGERSKRDKMKEIKNRSHRRASSPPPPPYTTAASPATAHHPHSVPPPPPLPAALGPYAHPWYPGVYPAWTGHPYAAAAMGSYLWMNGSEPLPPPPPLPPPRREDTENIYPQLLNLPLFATATPPPHAPMLFATPYRTDVAKTYNVTPAADAAGAATRTEAVSQPPPWRTATIPVAQPTVSVSAAAVPPPPPPALDIVVTPLPSTRARLERDIQRHDELLAAISTLQNAAAEEAFQRP